MSTEDYQNLLLCMGVAVTVAVKPQSSDPWAGACSERSVYLSPQWVWELRHVWCYGGQEQSTPK